MNRVRKQPGERRVGGIFWEGACGGHSYLAAQFRRVAARRGVKRALVAVAHSPLAIINGCSPVNPRMPAWALPTLMNGIATTPANVSSLAWSGSVTASTWN
jgi:hypothetical protein